MAEQRDPGFAIAGDAEYLSALFQSLILFHCKLVTLTLNNDRLCHVETNNS